MNEYSVTVTVAVAAENAVEARLAVVSIIERGAGEPNEDGATTYYVTRTSVEVL